MPAPGKPTNVYAAPTGDTGVLLKWVDGADAASAVVKKNTVDDIDSATEAGTVEAEIQQLAVTGLDPLTWYYFWIVNVNEDDEEGEPTKGYKVQTLADGLSITDLTKFEDVIVAFVKAASGFDDESIIWLHQSGPKPLKGFIGLKVAGPSKLGSTDHYDGLLLQGDRKMTLEVWSFADEAFKGAAMQALFDIQTAYGDPSLRDVLNAGGLVAGEISEVRDLATVLDTKWEQKLMFEATLYFGSIRAISVEAIETVELTGGV